MDRQYHIVYQMLTFLPKHVLASLKYVNMRYVYEIRLRKDQPIFINYCGKYRYLGVSGLTEHHENAIIGCMEDIESSIYRAGQYSVYSIEEQIRQGFLTSERGVRIGLSGEYVFEQGKPHTIRNFNAICIRIPHEIQGCGEDIYRACMSDKVRSVLIASPPGMGKTTILRDLARILSEKTRKNILICDERGEISIGNYGKTCDVIKYADKATAFVAGIRAMRPDIIITDELSMEDCGALTKAVAAGISVLASAHFYDIDEMQRPFMQIFERIVFLDHIEIGEIKGIYNNRGERLFGEC